MFFPFVRRIPLLHFRVFEMRRGLVVRLGFYRLSWRVVTRRLWSRRFVGASTVGEPQASLSNGLPPLSVVTSYRTLRHPSRVPSFASAFVFAILRP